MDRYSEWVRALVIYTPAHFVFLTLVEGPQSFTRILEATGLSTDSVAAQLELLQSLGIVEVESPRGHATYRIATDQVRAAVHELDQLHVEIRRATGWAAPSFRLPQAAGGEIGLADCLAGGPAIIWFSRGFTCSFCRHHRAQLSRGGEAFQRRGVRMVEVTPTPVDRAAMYFAHYQLTFPYLSDPDGAVASAYGVTRGKFMPLHTLRRILADAIGSGEFAREALRGPRLIPSSEELTRGGSDEGLFVVSQAGTVVFAKAGPSIGIPSNAELVKAIEVTIER